MRNLALKKTTPYGTAYFHYQRWIVAVRIDGRHTTRPLSRLMYAEKHGPIPDGLHIHHADGQSWIDEDGNFMALSPALHNFLHKWMNCWRTIVDPVLGPMKHCHGCDTTKPVDEFYSNGFTKGSRCKAYKPYCCECQKKATLAKQSNVEWRPVSVRPVLGRNATTAENSSGVVQAPAAGGPL